MRKGQFRGNCGHMCYECEVCHHEICTKVTCINSDHRCPGLIPQTYGKPKMEGQVLWLGTTVDETVEGVRAMGQAAAAGMGGRGWQGAGNAPQGQAGAGGGAGKGGGWHSPTVQPPCGTGCHATPPLPGEMNMPCAKIGCPIRIDNWPCWPIEGE